MCRFAHTYDFALNMLLAPVYFLSFGYILNVPVNNECTLAHNKTVIRDLRV